MLALILPLGCFALLFLRLLRSRPDRDPRESFLAAALVWGVALLAGTELLSLGAWLTPVGLAVFWGAACAVAAWLAWRSPAARAPTRPRLTGGTLALGAALALLLLLTALIALRAWPNQWDTMVYHLPRVDHWLRNRSVSFYPTHIVRQLASAPWAEYAVLHLVALAGDERAANLAQWFGMAGSLAGVSLIARRLGAGARGQLFAAIVCATIPMGLLQIPTGQNDLVASFWLVCLTARLLAPRTNDPATRDALEIGAALGLALATKGTAYVLAGPLLVSLALARGRPTAAAAARAALVLAVALALGIPQYARNVETFGFPLGPRQLGAAVEDDRLTNEALTPRILVSNVVRNLSLHLAAPWSAFNEALGRAIAAGHDWLGADLEDPRSTRLYPLERFEIAGPTNDPSRTGNPLHLLLIAVACVAIALSRHARERRLGLIVAAALVLSFVLFCALLKWQPWHSRLHLPLFVLGSSLVGAAFDRRPRAVACIVPALLALALATLATSVLQPLLGPASVLHAGRIEQYFPGRPFLREEYVRAAERVREVGCREVGLLLGWDDYEHPLWALLPEAASRGGRIEHVGVTNPSRVLESRRAPFEPCALIATTETVRGDLELESGSYAASWIGERLLVLEPR